MLEREASAENRRTCACYPLIRRLIKAALEPLALAVRLTLMPVNAVLATLFRGRVKPNSVLHISYMVHIPYETVGHLRRHGMTADYLAIGTSPYWNKCDYRFVPSIFSPIRAFQEFWLFWTVVSRYEVVHAHFMYTVSATGWELPLLKRMGRKLVAHFRGCEARDRTLNMRLHPAVNICQTCDHHPYICETASAVRRRGFAERFADVFLVTTPDMRDFLPNAIHFPFFAPDVLENAVHAVPATSRPFKIVHISNQPGIEGTAEIERAVSAVRERGHDVEFHWLRNQTHDEVLAQMADADLAVGKMKMGYYANAQIETMANGVPTVTYIRDEFITDELRQSGLILTTLAQLADTLEWYILNPDALAEKRKIARTSILRLHDNEALARRLMAIYRGALEHA